MAITNRGKKLIFDYAFRKATLPGNYKFLLVSDTPTQTTNVLSDLTEVANGNGYTSGGQSVSLNSTDFDTLTENDTDHYGEVQLKNFVWTASGGSIPASGNPPLFVCLGTNDGDPQIIAYESLGGAKTILNGTALTIADFFMRMGGELSELPTQYEQGMVNVSFEPGSKGDYAQLIASTGFKATSLTIIFRLGNNGQHFDLATGAAASEAILIPDIEASALGTISDTHTLWGSIQVPCNIAASTRIAARGQKDSGSAVNGMVQVIIGGP